MDTLFFFHNLLIHTFSPLYLRARLYKISKGASYFHDSFRSSLTFYHRLISGSFKKLGLWKLMLVVVKFEWVWNFEALLLKNRRVFLIPLKIIFSFLSVAPYLFGVRNDYCLRQKL